VKTILALLLLALLGAVVSAQSSLPEFGMYSDEERDLKECSFDKEADAVILLDDAYVEYSYGTYGMKISRRIRIKILNERGLDRANIIIPFYSKDEYEFISNVQGITYTDNQKYTLQNSNVFTEKEKLYSNLRFALPNVKPGSIIEYKYDLSRRVYDLEEWRFQSDIPTIKSCFMFRLHPQTQFSYIVYKKENYFIIKKEFKDENKYYFEMENIPGLHDEPFMDARKDYLQRIVFQLTGISSIYGGKRSINSTWKEVAKTLLEDKDIGGVLRKNLGMSDDLKPLVSQQTSNTGKLTMIYNYVRNNFSWNGYTGLAASDGIKKVCDSRTGNAAGINLVLVNLLQDYGIDAFPLTVAERQYGRVNPDFPLIESFNKTIAYATVDGKSFIMDATQKYYPPALTPFPLLNTYALVINKKTTDVLEIGNDNQSYKIFATIIGSLDKSGILSGNASIFDYDYAKVLQSERIMDDEKKFIQYYEQGHEGLTIHDFAYDNLKNDSMPLVERFAIKNQFNESGGYVLVNYNLFTGLRKNPFINKERFTNVNFGFPINIDVQLMFDLPENCQVQELPENKKLTTSQKDVYLIREIKQSANTIHIRIKFMQTVTLVPYEAYPALKDFYKLMVDMLNEPITIKLNAK
jgi:hypothetical protein